MREFPSGFWPLDSRHAYISTGLQDASSPAILKPATEAASAVYKTMRAKWFLFKMVYKHHMINISVLEDEWNIPASTGKADWYEVGLN